MSDLATWIIALFNNSVRNTWSSIFRLSHFLRVFVQAVLLASILNTILIKENLIELLKFCNLFTVTFQALSQVYLFKEHAIYLHSLMTILDAHGSMFSKIKVRPLKLFLCSKPWLKNNMEICLSNVCGQTMVENTSATYLKTIVSLKVFSCNI